MVDRDVLTHQQWERIEALLPPQQGAMGRPCVPHRPVEEGIIYRYRAGIPWRDLPERFGPWQTVWKRHHRWSADGTWDRVLAEVLADAETDEQVGWKVSVDSTIVRAHQHGTNASRDTSGPSSYTVRTRRCSRIRPRDRCLGSAQGAESNYKDRPGRREEPVDHGLGRSRGGLSTKVHMLVDDAAVLRSAGSIRGARPRRQPRGCRGHDLHDHAPTSSGCCSRSFSGFSGFSGFEAADVMIAQRVEDQPGEQANAELKSWRILLKIRSSPAHAGLLVNAVQAVIIHA